MPTVLQFRRGTTAQNNAFTGSAGEIVFNTTTGALRVHDGVTAGGGEMLLTDGSNADSGLSEYVADTAGAMWTSNTESNITVTYQDADNTLDISLDNTAVTAGSYGGSSAIPVITVDAQGRITSASTASVSSDLPVAGDSGTGTISLLTETLTIAGGTNLNSSMSGNTLTVNLDTSPTIGGNLTVTGNLTVNGTTTTVNTTNLAVSDAVIQCASGNSSASASYIGIQAERGGTDAYMVWEESSDRWRATTSTDGVTHSNANMQCATLYGTATTAQYADLAENYVADANYEPGTVLVFGGAKEVTVSAEQEDRRIAGVVSTDPAHLMNSECAGEHIAPIALQGRVPCRVTGTVNKGDLIVSSITSGVGMAWTKFENPRTGAVIGKALEHKDTEGEAVIEVVVGVR